MPYTARPGIDWGSVAQMLDMERRITEAQQQQKIQAIQWQGQQDYQTLVNSGIEPREALKRTAPKLFYSDPRGMANAIVAAQNTYGPGTEPITKTLPDGTVLVWTGQSYQQVKKQPLGPEAYTTITTVDPKTKERQSRRVLTSELEAQKGQEELQSATSQYQQASEALGGMSSGLFGIGREKNLQALGQAEETLQKRGVDIPAAAAYAARFRTGQGGAVPTPLGAAVAPGVPAPAQQNRTDIPTAPPNPKDRQLNQLYIGPSGKAAIWTKDGWKVPDKFSLLPKDVQWSNAGIRG